VEIEILHDLNHENIIQLLDAYFYDNKLWVSYQLCVIQNINLENIIQLFDSYFYITNSGRVTSFDNSAADPNPGSRIGFFWIPDLGSRIPDPGSRISDPGSRISDLGSRITNPYV
jgi:hypothetical protein